VTRLIGRNEPVAGHSAPDGWSPEKWAALNRRERRAALAGRGTLGVRRADSAVAAQRAGDCGRSAPPVGYHRRIGAYQRQNGSEKLTPKQQRRANKKLKLELVADAVYGTEAGVSL
jgi:hypothetical protein